MTKLEELLEEGYRWADRRLDPTADLIAKYRSLGNLPMDMLLREGYIWSDRRNRRLSSKVKFFWKIAYKVRYVAVRI